MVLNKNVFIDKSLTLTVTVRSNWVGVFIKKKTNKYFNNGYKFVKCESNHFTIKVLVYLQRSYFVIFTLSIPVYIYINVEENLCEFICSL